MKDKKLHKNISELYDYIIRLEILQKSEKTSSIQQKCT